MAAKKKSISGRIAGNKSLGAVRKLNALAEQVVHEASRVASIEGYLWGAVQAGKSSASLETKKRSLSAAMRKSKEAVKQFNSYMAKVKCFVPSAKKKSPTKKRAPARRR